MAGSCKAFIATKRRCIHICRYTFFLIRCAGLPRLLRQPRQRLFKLHAVPDGRGVGAGAADALQREVHRQPDGLLQRPPLHHAAQHRGGENVAGAVETGVNFLIKIGKIPPCAAVVGHGAQVLVVKADAGEHHAGSEGRQLSQQLPHKGFVGIFPIGRVRQQAGLRQIGHQHVRPPADFFHILRKIRRKGLVEPPVVGHGRIHHDEGVLRAQQVEHPAHGLRLSGRGQIAAADGVQLHLLAFPVAGNGQQLVRQVAAGEVGKNGVGAQHRRGDHGALHPHHRQHRQRHRQGAPAEAGDVLYACHSFHGQPLAFLRQSPIA